MENFFYDIALPLPLRQSFTYQHNDKLAKGTRVVVPFRNRKLVGYVLRKKTNSKIKSIKRIEKVLDEYSLLDIASCDLINWISNYYKAPIGEVYKSFFPPLLRKGNSIDNSIELFKITNLGLLINKDSLKRAKKQSEALEVFQSKKELSVSGLKAHNISRAIVKELERKTYVEKKVSVKQNPASKNKINNKFFLKLNKEQLKVYEDIKKTAKTNLAHLIFGITGSGKTEVYFNLIKDCILQEKQVLLLVPEIGLTPNLKAEIEKRFGTDNVALMHSAMTEKERALSWSLINKGHKSILVGTRSAALTPFKNLGLIIVDEEHDSSYKQFDGFKYSARDVAVFKSNRDKIPVILCSATPSLESLKNCNEKKYSLHLMNRRVKNAKHPKFEISDLRSSELKSGLTEYSLGEITKEVEKGNQVLVFLNKKGFAPMVFCKSCGWTPECRNCDVSMVFHINPERLVCHHCGETKQIKSACEVCFEENLEFFSAGTEKLEVFLKKRFVSSPVFRIDRDNFDKKTLKENNFFPKTSQSMILVGTQILAKGHHIPNLTLVVVVDADSGLFSIDHRASERLAQLIIQVSGRAGREDKEGRVILQSYVPDHPFLEKISTLNYQEIANEILEERENLQLPPFVHHINIHAESLNKNLPENVLHKICKFLKMNETQFIGPKPAIIEKRKKYFRWVLTLKSADRKKIHHLANRTLAFIETQNFINKVRISIDVDPIS